jgi:hypothetical protein
VSLCFLCFLIGMKLGLITRSRANFRRKPTSVEDFSVKVEAFDAPWSLHTPHLCQTCIKPATTNKTSKDHDREGHDRSRRDRSRAEVSVLLADKHDSFSSAVS